MKITTYKANFPIHYTQEKRHSSNAEFHRMHLLIDEMWNKSDALAQKLAIKLAMSTNFKTGDNL